MIARAGRVLVWAGLAMLCVLAGQALKALDAEQRDARDQQNLRFWRFQAQQASDCRRAGGFPNETWIVDGRGEGPVFVSCSFKPEGPR